MTQPAPTTEPTEINLQDRGATSPYWTVSRAASGKVIGIFDIDGDGIFLDATEVPALIAALTELTAR